MTERPTTVRSLAELVAAFDAGLREQLEDSGRQRALLGALMFEDRPLSIGDLEQRAKRDEGETRSAVEIIVDAAVESVAQALYYDGLEEADSALRDIIRSWQEWDAPPVGQIGTRGRPSALAEPVMSSS